MTFLGPTPVTWLTIEELCKPVKLLSTWIYVMMGVAILGFGPDGSSQRPGPPAGGLQPSPDSPNCVSSQSSNPRYRIAPWDMGVNRRRVEAIRQMMATHCRSRLSAAGVSGPMLSARGTYKSSHNSPYVVIPAEAGIQWLSGCRIKSGMTVLFRGS